MKLKTQANIAIRIILICIIGMIMAEINSHLHGFFGDKYIGNNAFQIIHDGYDWSSKHYWFAIMCTALMILSVVSFIKYLIDLSND